MIPSMFFFGAGGGIRTHEGLRHRVLSPRRARFGALCPFDLAMVPPRDGAPGGIFRGKRPLLNPRSTALEIMILRRWLVIRSTGHPWFIDGLRPLC
jgi:hypothetical protein